MKTDTSACVAGALPSSGMPFPSQKQCHMSKPAPYDTRVSSSHAWSIVSFTRSCSALLRLGVFVSLGAGDAGVHSRRRSLARQCGRRCEGTGVRCCGYGAGPLSVGVVADRMVSCLGLTSRTFLSLATRGPTSGTSCSRVRTRRPIAIFLASSPGLDIEEERADLVGDDDGIKQEGAGRVDPSRGTVSGVFGTRDVSRVNCFTARLR